MLLHPIGTDPPDFLGDDDTAIFENAHARMEEAREQLGEPTSETVRVALDSALNAIHHDVEKQLAAVLGPEDVARIKSEIPPPRVARAPKSV